MDAGAELAPVALRVVSVIEIVRFDPEAAGVVSVVTWRSGPRTVIALVLTLFPSLDSGTDPSASAFAIRK